MLKSSPSFCQCPASSTRSALSHNQVSPAPGRCSANGQPTTIESLKISEEILDATRTTVLGTGPDSFSHCYPTSGYFLVLLLCQEPIFTHTLLFSNSQSQSPATNCIVTISTPVHPASTITRWSSSIWTYADDLLVPLSLPSSLSVTRRGLKRRRQSDNTSNYLRSAVKPPRIQPKITKSPLHIQLHVLSTTRQASVILHHASSSTQLCFPKPPTFHTFVDSNFSACLKEFSLAFVYLCPSLAHLH